LLSHYGSHVDQDEFGGLCSLLKKKQTRLPGKDLERKQHAVFKFTQQFYTDVRYEVTRTP